MKISRVKMDKASCLVCLKCGSMEFNHTKTTLFKEEIVNAISGVWIKRAYYSYHPPREKIICASCGSKEAKKIDLCFNSYEEIKKFFSMTNKERLDDVLKNTTNLHSKKEKQDEVIREG